MTTSVNLNPSDLEISDVTIMNPNILDGDTMNSHMTAASNSSADDDDPLGGVQRRFQRAKLRWSSFRLERLVAKLDDLEEPLATKESLTLRNGMPVQIDEDIIAAKSNLKSSEEALGHNWKITEVFKD